MPTTAWQTPRAAEHARTTVAARPRTEKKITARRTRPSSMHIGVAECSVATRLEIGQAGLRRAAGPRVYLGSLVVLLRGEKDIPQL